MYFKRSHFILLILASIPITQGFRPWLQHDLNLVSWLKYGTNRFSLKMAEEMTPSIYILPSISQIKREQWNKLNGGNPFLEYDWLNSLEHSKCVDVSTGWDPIHLIVGYQLPELMVPSDLRSNEIVVLAACPLYVKYHSYGEFIFDQQWASFAQASLGLKYYPKILSAVPFTPGTGDRLLVNPDLSDDIKANCYSMLIDAMKGLTINNKLLSANVNFMPEEEISYFQDKGFDLRQTLQYRWRNVNPMTNQKYKDFEEYLSCFKSKRRIQIKRERKSVYEDQNVRIEAFRGDDERANATMFAAIYDIYATTIEKMYGQEYLSKKFFESLAQCPSEFRHKIVFIIAYDSKNNIIAGTFNLASSTHFYGRYWGAFSYIKNLHFEVCYYAAIEFCINQGIDFLEPGAGGGEYKFLRGFDPFLIHSMHYFTDITMKTAVRNFLSQEREINKMSAETLVGLSPIASQSTTTTTTAISATAQKKQKYKDDNDYESSDSNSATDGNDEK